MGIARLFGSVKTGMSLEAFLDISKPEDALPKQVSTGSDLQNRQNIKKEFPLEMRITEQMNCSRGLV
jgi:hypothetical protein